MESNMTFFEHAMSPRGRTTPGSNRIDEDLRSNASSSRNSASTSISVIIGKTFEAATLPDGSQQIIEVTKYKRLSDGYVYTESKMRSLEDDRDRRDDVVRNNGTSTEGERHRQQQQQQQHQRRQPPKPFGKLYPDPADSLLSTFSSSGSFSPDNGSNLVSVITEDHGFVANSGLEFSRESRGWSIRSREDSIVEEYLHDGGPVQRWDQARDRRQQQGGEGGGGERWEGLGETSDNNNDGWFPARDKDEDQDEDNSLQLAHQKTSAWESPLSPVTQRAKETIRTFFPSTPKHEEKTSRGTLYVNYRIGAVDEGDDDDEEEGRTRQWSSGEEDDDEAEGDEQEHEAELGVTRALRLSCNERMKTRRCRVLVFALVLAVIGTVAAAIGLSVSSSGRAVDGPAERAEEPEGKEERPLDASGDGADDAAAGTTAGEAEATPGANAGEVQVITPGMPNDTMEETVVAPAGEVEKNPGEPSNAAEEAAASPSDETVAVATAAPPTQEGPSCVRLKIVMAAAPGTGDLNEWSLSRVAEQGADAASEEAAIVIDSGDVFVEPDGGSRRSTEHCVPPGVYTFAISDSGGDGLGGDNGGAGGGGNDGYYITADGVTLGVSNFFFHEERMTFTLPLLDEVSGSSSSSSEVCTDDFYLAIKTDGRPEETEWNVVDNDSGELALHGGPYDLPWAVYTRRACLPDGNYTFNMLDEGGDGVCCDDGKGFVFLSGNGETIVNSDGNFGNEQSTVFLVGGDRRQ